MRSEMRRYTSRTGRFHSALESQLASGGRRLPMSLQQLETLVQMLRAQPVAQPTIEGMRAAVEQMVQGFPPSPDVKAEKTKAGNVNAEWVTAPGADANRAILYLHGGGYVAGSINSHRDLAGRLSRAAQARVLVIDYRLAPEHPFPAAVDDAVAAYRWMLAQGLKPNRIAVAGDSAGGGLTAATLVAIRDAGLQTPAAGVCISPWTDMEGIGESMTTKAAVDPMVQKATIVNLAKVYLAGKDPRTPLAAPIYADLKGLPPLLIQVGGNETLLDDAVRLADRARKTGVAVTLEPWDNMVHVWHLFAPMLDEGQKAIDRIGEFVRKQAA
jgi:monoterpene epsilon-lactone hydrolase